MKESYLVKKKTDFLKNNMKKSYFVMKKSDL